MKQTLVGLPPLMGELYGQLEALKLESPEAFEKYEQLYMELKLIDDAIGRMSTIGAYESMVRPGLRRRHTPHFRIMPPVLPTDWGDATIADKLDELPFTYVVGPWPPGQPITKCPNCGHPLP